MINENFSNKLSIKLSEKFDLIKTIKKIFKKDWKISEFFEKIGKFANLRIFREKIVKFVNFPREKIRELDSFMQVLFFFGNFAIIGPLR